MTRFINAFLEFKNEAEGTRRFALLAVVVITVGLASLSITGVIATATWTWLSILPTLGVIIAVAGAEALATVVFVRTLTAPTLKRRIAGYIMFAGLAAVGVRNAENGAHVVWADRFVESSASLVAKAGVSQDQADTAKTDRPKELALVRANIAELEVFTKEMAAQTPEGIKKAQTDMIPRCGYDGFVDGIRSRKTESAMRSCGEQIRNELITLRQRENNLLGVETMPAAEGGGIAPAVTDPALAAINLEELARKAFWNWFWLIFMLVTLESARSLALWALITDMTGMGVNRARQMEDELAEARHRAELAKYNDQPKAPEPLPVSPAEPVASPVAAEAPTPPPELELTQAQIWGREGAKQAQMNRQVEKAIKGRVLVIGPTATIDAVQIAEKVAAE